MTADMQNHPAVRLASRTLAACQADRWDDASALLTRIVEEHGGDGVCLALTAWCDAYADHATDGLTGDEPVHAVDGMNYMNAKTGAMGAESMPDRIRWAGEMITARAAMDRDWWLALLADTGAHPHLLSERVWAVLECVALTTTRLPRGYAVAAARAAWLTVCGDRHPTRGVGCTQPPGHYPATEHRVPRVADDSAADQADGPDLRWGTVPRG